MLLAQLAIGVLGVLVVSAEYSTGTIRATFSAVPRRDRWCWWPRCSSSPWWPSWSARSSPSSPSCLGQHILSGKTPTASLSDPTVVRAVVSAGLYLTALGLLALGLATIIRHTAAAISTFVGLLFILPIIADVLPSSFANDVDRFVPADIGTRMMTRQLSRRRSVRSLGQLRPVVRLRGARADRRRRPAGPPGRLRRRRPTNFSES